jgi:hypothetical protein
VPLDLSRIHLDGDDKLIDPRDIFASLPTKPWPRLRLEQGEVLKEWFARRNQRDLVIKQNTGGGKTVIGLLAAQSSLNEDVGPAVYLVPDTYLVKQVADEARRLGLPVTLDHRDTNFRASKAILIATFDKLINGRSVFGVAGYRETVPIGTIVVDDAHASLAAARKQFTATIPSDRPAYGKLLSLFANDLRAQNVKNFADLEAGDHCSPMRIPFWAWSDRQDRILAILRTYSDDDTLLSLYFPWHLISEHLPITVATMTNKAIEIKNPCPPIDMIPAFAQAMRRIYLTATLADDGVLVTELGADANSVERPITPERAADLGDRMILAPLALNPQMVAQSIRELARQIADGDRDGDGRAEAGAVNVVVLVPSDMAATDWAEHADYILHVGDMKPVIDRLARGEHLGIVVLVNKYDGVDLPGDACRVLIIDGIPTPLDASERRESSALTGSSTYIARKVQRLEQGMGRGIRDAEDHCAVLLLGREPALALVEPNSRELFSPATRAQIELSERIANQIAGEGLDAIREALMIFLRRDAAWMSLSSRATAGVEYDRKGHVGTIARARRRAFNQAAVNDPAAATETLRNALDAVPDDITKGWYLEEVAAYQHLSSPPDAQKTLKAARQLNRMTLKPTVAMPARETRGNARQGEAACDFLSNAYSDGVRLQLKIGSLLDDIAWDPDRTEDAEEAVRLLGLHFGFVSTRPEREYGIGPDNHWAMNATANAVIELKTGVIRSNPKLIRREVDQLSGAIHWDEEHNEHASIRVPVIVHPGFELSSHSSPPPGTRVISVGELERFKKTVAAFAADLAINKSWTSARAVADALTRHKLTADQIMSAHSRKPASAAASKLSRRVCKLTRNLLRLSGFLAVSATHPGDELIAGRGCAGSGE